VTGKPRASPRGSICDLRNPSAHSEVASASAIEPKRRKIPGDRVRWAAGATGASEDAGANELAAVFGDQVDEVREAPESQRIRLVAADVLALSDRFGEC
jgi:hypothetical protein